MSNGFDISIRRITNPILFAINRVGEALSFGVERIESPITFIINKVGEELSFNAERIGSPIEFKCGLVLDINSEFYLDVPQDHIWLTPENDFSQDVVVCSNVTWVIE